MRQFLTWFLLLLIGLMFVVVGIQGSGGRVLAVVFTPACLDVVT